MGAQLANENNFQLVDMIQMKRKYFLYFNDDEMFLVKKPKLSCRTFMMV